MGGTQREKTVPVNIHWGQVLTDRKGSSWYEGCWEVPFVQGGIGVWHSNIDYPNFPNDFNFSPQAGVGIQYFTCTCMSFHIEYRIQHFSNAGTRSDNPGLDFNNVLAGISWYF